MAHQPVRLQGLTADGEVVELPELSEIQIMWEEGSLPVNLVLAPEHLSGHSLSLEVASSEDEDDQMDRYGVLTLRPGACNVVDISVETHLMEDEDEHVHGPDCQH